MRFLILMAGISWTEQFFCLRRDENLGSIAEKIGGVISGIHYSASKGALICLTKSFATLLALYQITVNALDPGIIESDMTKKWPVKSTVAC